MHSFITGDFINALKYNITFTATYIMLIIFWGIFTFKIFKKQDYQKFTIKYLTVFGIIFIVLIILNTLLRNILPYPHLI